MILLAGLGNPGEKYAQTRHNVGFMFADYLLESLSTDYQLPATSYIFDKYAKAEIAKIDLQATDYKLQAIIAKPQTYMNRSGESVAKLMKNSRSSLSTFQPFNLPTYPLPATSLFVAHDDLDIELGKFKIQQGIGPKKHNGLLSIEQHLHTADYWRIRIGVDNRQGDRTLSGEEYVLQNFSAEEQNSLNNLFPQITEKLLQILS